MHVHTVAHRFDGEKVIGPQPVAFQVTEELRVQPCGSFTVSWYRAVFGHLTTASACEYGHMYTSMLHTGDALELHSLTNKKEFKV